MTTPRVRSKAGYQSALIGEHHLSGPENNPDGNDAPVALEWGYFNGQVRCDDNKRAGYTGQVTVALRGLIALCVLNRLFTIRYWCRQELHAVPSVVHAEASVRLVRVAGLDPESKGPGFVLTCVGLRQRKHGA